MFPLLSQDALRWGGSAVVVALLHAGVVFPFACRHDEPNDETGAPVVMMELAPVASASPSPPNDLPPGPEQDEAEAQQASLARQIEKPQEEPLHKDEFRTEDPEVSLPTPERSAEPDQSKAEQSAPIAAAEAAAPPNAEAVADRAKGPPVGRHSARPSPAVINWRNSMLGRLKRFHRYPAAAHNASGVALVEFAIDRDGRLLSHRLVKSSGNAALDLDFNGACPAGGAISARPRVALRTIFSRSPYRCETNSKAR